MTTNLQPDISIENLRENISKERKIVSELNSLYNYMKNSDNRQEKNMISSQIQGLTSALNATGKNVLSSAEKISLFQPLDKKKTEETKENKVNVMQINKKLPVQEKAEKIPMGKLKFKPDILEKLAIKRTRKKEEKEVKKVKEKKPSIYVKFSSKLFYNYSMSLINKGKFRRLRRDLVKSNLGFVPGSYISVIFFSTLVSVVAAVFVMLFFLFFNVGATPPFITIAGETLASRFLKVFWLLFAIPVAAFAFTYFYPSLEKRSLESKLNQELPFAVIHMSSISSSMIEPSKIFGIIISTKEYPYLEKEFIMLQNEINIYGYDLVTVLKNRSYNSPSRKLSELFNGLATTITSGGNLPEFFDKRAQTLLFEHRLDKERQSKAAETFMDIYISVVIAAPMILMLLLIMMRISGLGISLSTGTITLIMVLGVTLINILFLTFLQLKQPGE